MNAHSICGGFDTLHSSDQLNTKKKKKKNCLGRFLYRKKNINKKNKYILTCPPSILANGSYMEGRKNPCPYQCDAC